MKNGIGKLGVKTSLATTIAVGAAALGAVALFVRAMPDLVRYLRLRRL